jgi:stage II sporulation protein AB (anti-sigma F factor)
MKKQQQIIWRKFMDNELRCVFNAKVSNIKVARSIGQIFFSEIDSSISFMNEVKTIISEAVTNAIIHGCQSDEAMDVYMNLSYDKNFIFIEVIDKGIGILDVELAKTPMFTTKPDDERSGLGLTLIDVFSDEMIIESFHFVHLGNTVLMFGPYQDEKWNTISLKDVPELQPDEIENPIEQSEEKIEELSASSKNNKDEQGKNDHATKNVKSKVLKYTFQMCLWTAIALVISTSYVLYRDQPKNSTKHAKQVPLDQKLRTLIKSLNIENNLNISRNHDDNISVIGYVRTMEQSAKIKSEIRKVTDRANIKIYSVEKVLNTCKEIIVKSKHEVHISPGVEMGHFTVRGFIYKVDEWEFLKSELKSVKGMIKIRDEVLTKENANQELKAILSANGFGKLLEPKITKQGMQIVGTITDKDQLAWNIARKEIEDTFSKMAKIDFIVNVTTDRNMTIEKFFGGAIESVNYSNKGLDWVNTKNGHKYFNGSVLPSGYVISEITKNSITIKNADEELTIELDWI